MKYKIIETHIIYDDNGLKEIAVLWDDNGYFRATYATLGQKVGYIPINSDDALNDALLQRVAGFGIYLDDDRKENYFPNVKNWSR